jgi:hypothetical protein
MNEIWKDVVGYEGLYQVSNIGSIMRVKRNILTKDNKIKTLKTLIMKQALSNNEYPYKTCILTKNKTSSSFLVHRLVAQAFIPNPNNKPCINHKNGIKTDNRTNNLEWCTHKENSQHAFKTELMIGLRGELNNSAKLTRLEVIDIRKRKANGEPIINSYRYYGRKVAKITIKNIWDNKTWKHIKI